MYKRQEGLSAAIPAGAVTSIVGPNGCGKSTLVKLAAGLDVYKRQVERFREEIRMGRSVKAASITGVKHAIFTSIDADLVTMVSALCLSLIHIWRRTATRSSR